MFVESADRTGLVRLGGNPVLLLRPTLVGLDGPGRLQMVLLTLVPVADDPYPGSRRVPQDLPQGL